MGTHVLDDVVKKRLQTERDIIYAGQSLEKYFNVEKKLEKQDIILESFF